jgi:tetratricopeptide (TPR) repeat protein
MTPLCPDDRLKDLLARLKQEQGLAPVEAVLRDYPNDPRLLFLQGSLLAGRQEYAAAREVIRKAVDLAPDFAIARFQLGLLQLTSGEAVAAQETWGPLHSLPDGHYIKSFVVGLCHLIKDEFPAANAELERGIAHNQENPPLNRDMQMIIDEVRSRRLGEGEGSVSSVDLLLQQAALRGTRH